MKYSSFIPALIALGGLPAVFAQSPALTYIPNSSVKVYQVNGDCDWAVWDATIANKTPTCKPTTSQTATKADVLGDDVPVAFEHNGELIVTFGDTIGAAGNSAWTSLQNSFGWGAHDPIARSTTTNASDGLLLNFFLNGTHGLEVLPPPQPNGTPVDMGVDNVPHTGVSLNGTIYLGIKTGNVSSGDGNNDQSHDYSVLATFDETTETFTSGRTISTLPNGHFAGPAFYLAAAGVLGSPPPVSPEPAVLIFGVGAFRASNVYLSIIPSTGFASGVDPSGNSATRYFSGMSNGQPTWSSTESSAVPVVTDLDPANPTIGNVSVFYSQPLGLWLMMYDGGRGSASTEGMYFAYAPKPWGPWSTPQLVFNSCRDRGYGSFMFYYYATAAQNNCPSAMPAGVTSAPNSAGPAGPTIGSTNDPTSTRGTAYAPTFVERFTIISGSTLKLFYMFATWNPYAVVMMESDFSIAYGPALVSGTLANGATYVAGGLVPGSWAQVKGTNLSNTTRIWAASDFSGLGSNLPTNLSGVQVMVNNLPAAVYYISPTQVNFQVPTGVAGTATVEVINNSVASNSLTASAATNSPAIFPNILNGTNYPAGVFYSDGLYVGDPSIGSAFRNARPGDIIELYATGLVPTPGGVVPSFQTISGVTVTIGSTTVPATAAGLVAVGEFQINFTVPQQFASLAAGTYPISIQVNGVSSPLTIASNPPGQLVLPIQH